MLFPSVKFIFAFLPLTLLAAWLAKKSGKVSLVNCLLIASLIFYVLPNLEHAYIIISSIVVNYALSSRIQRISKTTSLALMWLGILFNLAVIIHFKYLFFFTDVFNQLAGTNFEAVKLVLPVGISFYTFQQIAYLVDSYKYRDADYKFNQYSLFVCFFPQLIAGPIVHHKEIMPQIAQLSFRKIDFDIVSLGFVFFIIGLFKKILIADNFAQIANPIFDNPAEQLDWLSAWIGALAYTFQLYFDFSAYSEMAIGLGLMFGVKLPINFDSPYKACNIVDFWRRWHITLSRFLRDYLYIALGGNRKGEARRYINLMLTMLIGGLWHGAGWGFIIWGGLHGFYLFVNHARAHYLPQLKLPHQLSVALTFIAVVFAWVFFRAEDLSTAQLIVGSMLGQGSALNLNGIGPNTLLQLLCLVFGFACVWCLPNFARYIGYRGVETELSQLSQRVQSLWRSQRVVLSLSVLLALSLAFLPEPSVFIYFNF